MSIDFPAEEELVLARWREIDAFQRQLELSKDKPRYSFFDGPPCRSTLLCYVSISDF